MIRIDQIWLATEPLNMRAGPDKALARVIQMFGTAHPHCAYLFSNRRGNRMNEQFNGVQGQLLEDYEIRRAGHARMGVLVQPPATDGVAWVYPAGRS